MVDWLAALPDASAFGLRIGEPHAGSCDELASRMRCGFMLRIGEPHALQRCGLALFDASAFGLRTGELAAPPDASALGLRTGEPHA